MSIPSSLRDVVASRQGLFAPDSFVNTLSTKPRSPGSSAAVSALKDAASKGVMINAARYSCRVSIVPTNQPLKPVKLTDLSGKAKQTLNQLSMKGVPVPDDLFISGGTDASICIVNPGWVSPDKKLHGQEWGFWRVDASDPNNITAANGYRISGLVESHGTAVQRYNGGKYGVLPKSKAAQATYEDNNWRVSASGISLAAGAITPEDLDPNSGPIKHVIGFAVYHPMIAPGPVPPATFSDGFTLGALLQEGMVFRVPKGVTLPTNLHPVAFKLLEAAQNHGWVLVDRTGSGVSFRSEPNAEPYFGTTYMSQIFANFPWDLFELVTP
jgi:hypothetical protein